VSPFVSPFLAPVGGARKRPAANGLPPQYMIFRSFSGSWLVAGERG
jgi:hypothetical protein